MTTEEQIDRLKISLTEKPALLQDLDRCILEHTEESNIEGEIDEAERIKDELHGNLLRLNSYLKGLSNSPPPSLVNHQSTRTTTLASNTRLPKLVLEKFAGDPKTWQAWWDSFRVAVHENKISEVKKFNHLRSVLEGVAYATFAGLPLTKANYKVAIDLLQERFAQKQTIINSHMEAQLKLSGDNSMADIKNI